jgi:hypothetical protein
LFGRHDEVEVFDQVGADRVEIVEHRFDVVELRPYLFDRLADRIGRDFGGQAANRLAALLVPSRDLLDDLLELFLQRLDVGFDPRAFGLWQLLEDLGLDDLVVDGGREAKAHRRPDQGDPLIDRALAQVVEGVGLFVLEVLLDRLQPGLVLLVLEEGRHRRPHILDQPHHRL